MTSVLSCFSFKVGCLGYPLYNNGPIIVVTIKGLDGVMGGRLMGRLLIDLPVQKRVIVPLLVVLMRYIIRQGN